MSSRVTRLLFSYVVPLSENQTSPAPKQKRQQFHDECLHIETCSVSKKNLRTGGSIVGTTNYTSFWCSFNTTFPTACTDYECYFKLVYTNRCCWFRIVHGHQWRVVLPNGLVKVIVNVADLCHMELEGIYGLDKLNIWINILCRFQVV